ncbi:alpha/beta hydrolase [Muricauda amoyensis]|uniref:alpha/beta hydrolase n=1 Tax=Flagellimonas amoyensis TaxID=2169401 RepID=UPI00131F3D8D|nr:alpha/beta hydrolase-fold protein [Allomuricauda amoyensis]
MVLRKWVLLPVIALVCLVSSCDKAKPSYEDLSHFSKVFNKEKPYRIYLPKSYTDNADETYPVVYYLHGWGGTHMKDSSNLAYDSIGKLADKYKVIFVLLNGRMDDADPRPYNMGYHEHMTYDVQMKDYFPEVVSYIDSAYRTVDNRYGRALMGFSMGGMMTTYLSGKYPDMVGAAVDLCGSTEFYLGMPDNHTFYPLRYTFANLSDVPYRLRNSSHGELSALNKETNNGALWEGHPYYGYWQFEGGHEVDPNGGTEAFEKALSFLLESLQQQIPPQKSWSHYDVYPDFELWDYKVESDKSQPGLLFLSEVTKAGFGLYTHKWLPEGPALEGLQATVTTAAIYRPDASYTISDYNRKNGQLRTQILKSDAEGRLHVKLDGEGHEIGIHQTNDGPKPTFVGYTLGENRKMLRVGEENQLHIQIANLGTPYVEGDTVKFELKTRDSSVVANPATFNGVVKADGQIEIPSIAVTSNKVPPKDGSPFGVKAKLKMTSGDVAFENMFYMPVFFDVAPFDGLDIDDGRSVKDTLVGSGNGDGKVSPGEEILVYTNGHRAQLFYDDPYIVGEKLFDEALPAVWETDGITFSSIIKISEDCPEGHRLKLLAKYETKSHNPIARTVTWGTVELMVGKPKK